MQEGEAVSVKCGGRGRGNLTETRGDRGRTGGRFQSGPAGGEVGAPGLKPGGGSRGN